MVDTLPPGILPPDLLAGGPPMGPPGLPPAGMPPSMPPPSMPPPMVNLREEAKAARLRPYRLPVPERPPKPRRDWVMAQQKFRTQYWSGRNEEMTKDLELYLMAGAREDKDTGKGGEEVIRRITPRAMVDKLANMVSGQKDKIKVSPRASTQAYLDAAQAIEDYLYDWRRQLAAHHEARGNQSYAHDEAWHAAFGYIASRVCLHPDDEAWPFRGELYDPRNCYPTPTAEGPGQLADMLYHEKTDRETFLLANPQFAKKRAFLRMEREDGDPDQGHDIEFVWYENDWWSVIYLDGEEVEATEHEYGFCPWLMVPVGGTPLKDPESRRHHGAGVLRALRPTIEYDNRLHSQIASMVARAANPPTITTYDGNAGGSLPKPVDLSPGARNVLDASKKETYQPIGPTERADQVAMMQAMTAQDIARGGVPDILWNDQSAVNSGFQFIVMKANAEDVIRPITSAIKVHRQWQHRLVLNLILRARDLNLLDPGAVAEEDPALEPASGVRYRRPSRGKGDKRTQAVYSVLTPEDIERHGVENEVLLSNMTPQDFMQATQAGSMAVQAGLLSPEYVLEHVLHVDDVEGEMLKSFYWLGLTSNEQFMSEVLFPSLLRQRSPELYSAFMLHKEQLMAMQAAQAAPPPGPPPGEAPPDAAGLDSPILPPQLQAVTGVPGLGDPASMDAQQAMLAQTAPPGGF